MKVCGKWRCIGEGRVRSLHRDFLNVAGLLLCELTIAALHGERDSYCVCAFNSIEC